MAPRVLVVDDSDAIRRLIVVNLELEGYDVRTAVDGEQALEVVESWRPDVITLDVVMPRLDGLGTVGRLRLDPGTWNIPLVVVSASVVGGRELPEGVDAVMAKPFEPADLVILVRQLCEERRREAVQLAKRLA